MYAAFSVLRPSHNNQPLVESDFRLERPGEGRLVGLHSQISLNFDLWRWPVAAGNDMLLHNREGHDQQTDGRSQRECIERSEGLSCGGRGFAGFAKPP